MKTWGSENVIPPSNRQNTLIEYTVYGFIKVFVIQVFQMQSVLFDSVYVEKPLTHKRPTAIRNKTFYSENDSNMCRRYNDHQQFTLTRNYRNTLQTDVQIQEQQSSLMITYYCKESTLPGQTKSNNLDCKQNVLPGQSCNW